MWMDSKQGYTLKNWVEGLSDESYYPCPGSHQKFLAKIGQPYICQQTKESFYSSINGNMQVFQNNTKQAIIEVIFIFSHR